MTSPQSSYVSELKNFLIVNVNCSNSMSRIFQNGPGVEIFTKKAETSDVNIAPFETSQHNCGTSKNEENVINDRENLLRSKTNRDVKVDSINPSKRPVNKQHAKSGFHSSIMKDNEFFETPKDSCYLLSEKINSSFDLSKMDPRWTKKEEIRFIAVCLVHRLSVEKIKLSNLLELIETKTKKQFYRHYYSNRHSIQVLYDLLVKFKKIPIEVTNDPKKISEMFEFLKNQIFDKDFIEFFESNAKDERTKQYFKNIYDYLIFEPKFFIKSNQNEGDFYSSPKPKNKNLTKNSSKNISLKTSQCLSGYKLHDDLVLKNLSVRIEDKLYTKLLSFSRDKNKLIIDDLFLYDYAMSEL